MPRKDEMKAMTKMIIKSAPDTDVFCRKVLGKVIARVLYIFEVDGIDYVRTKDFSTIIGSNWCWGCPRTWPISIDFPKGMGTNDTYLWPLDVAIKARKIRNANPMIGVTKAVEMAVPMLRRMVQLLHTRYQIDPINRRRWIVRP